MAGLRLPASQDGVLMSRFLVLHYSGSCVSSIHLADFKLALTAPSHLGPPFFPTARTYTGQSNKHVCSIFRVGEKPINPTTKTKYYIKHRRTPQQVNLKRWNQAKILAPRFLQVSANSKADDSIPFEMSFESALKLLGVAEGASFDEILRAKNRLLERSNGDQEFAIKVEAAYDLLLMQSLMERRAGKVLDSAIRYADVKKAKGGSTFFGGKAGPKWLKGVIDNFPVAVDSPSSSALGTQTAVYAALVVWTFASGFSSSPGEAYINAHADVPGFILAIGFGASLYFLRKKNVKLGKAAAITIAGLAAGAIFGGAVESWLRVDLIPVFGIGSPAVVVSEFVLISLWLSSLYLL